jgi:predicted adenylyl cyclase CyaB
MPIETEIKFRVDDVAELSQRLEAAGFRLQTPRAFESNVLYDTPDRQMRARTEILRIRGYAGRNLITHKRLPIDGPGEDTHKHRIETETEVADGAAIVIALSMRRRSATTRSWKARRSGSTAPPRAWALSGLSTSLSAMDGSLSSGASGIAQPRRI